MREEGKGQEWRGGGDYTEAVCQINNWSNYTDPSVGRAYHLVDL